MKDPFRAWDALFGTKVGVWPEPPETVPLRLLGLDKKPTHQNVVKSAFRAKVVAVHPDLALNVEARDDPEIRELVWARDVLLRMTPEPVTDGKGEQLNTFSIRNYPKKCHTCGVSRPPHSKERWVTVGSLYWCAKCSPEHVPCCMCGGEAPGPKRRMWTFRNPMIFCEDCDRNRREKWEEKFGNTYLRSPRWHKCVQCGVAMTPYRAGTLYCGDQCRRISGNKRQKARRLYRRKDRTCECCGETFTPARSDAKYCSPACRQKAYRDRQTQNDPGTE